jgi:hypothetical protein
VVVKVVTDTLTVPDQVDLEVAGKFLVLGLQVHLTKVIRGVTVTQVHLRHSQQAAEAAEPGAQAVHMQPLLVQQMAVAQRAAPVKLGILCYLLPLV